MPIELYYTILALAAFFLWYGWYVKSDMFRLIGCVFLVFIGGAISPSIPSLIGTIEYQVGETEVVSGNETVITYDYQQFESHRLGWFLSLSGILGFVLVMVDRREDGY